MSDEPTGAARFGPVPDRIEVTYVGPVFPTFGELGWPAIDPATTERQIETASAFIEDLKLKIYFDPEVLGPQGMLLVATKCGCSHSITNHLTGVCDVCPCQRSVADMAVKLNIEE